MECIRSNYFNDSFGLLLLILCRVKNYVSYMCNTKNGMLVNLEYANIGASSENPVSSNQSTQPLRVKFEGWGQFYFWNVQPENIYDCLSITITIEPLHIHIEHFLANSFGTLYSLKSFSLFQYWCWNFVDKIAIFNAFVESTVLKV